MRYRLGISRRLCVERLGRKELQVSTFLLPGPGRDLPNEREVAAREFVQASFHRFEAVEAVHPFGAGAEFTRCLRPAQEKHAE